MRDGETRGCCFLLSFFRSHFWTSHKKKTIFRFLLDIQLNLIRIDLDLVSLPISAAILSTISVHYRTPLKLDRVGSLRYRDLHGRISSEKRENTNETAVTR